MKEALLTFYAVKSKDGKYLRSKGYSGGSGGNGKNWVDEIKKAKVWGKIGAARAQVTWWADNYPKYGIPDLIELRVTEAVVLDEEQRVKDSIRKKEEAKLRREKEWREYELEQAKKKLQETQVRIKKLEKQNV